VRLSLDRVRHFGSRSAEMAKGRIERLKHYRRGAALELAC
jgi:hypothetical protein